MASAADLAEAPRTQWREREDDGASIEAVHGSAEGGEGRDRSRNAAESRSGAAVEHSQQEGEKEQREFQWDDEVSHDMPRFEQTTIQFSCQLHARVLCLWHLLMIPR